MDVHGAIADVVPADHGHVPRACRRLELEGRCGAVLAGIDLRISGRIPI
jgi:hypothetical protein